MTDTNCYSLPTLKKDQKMYVTHANSGNYFAFKHNQIEYMSMRVLEMNRNAEQVHKQGLKRFYYDNEYSSKIIQNGNLFLYSDRTRSLTEIIETGITHVCKKLMYKRETKELLLLMHIDRL